MNRKLHRVLEEIRKTEKKIAEWQEHLKELKLLAEQLENQEIVKTIRSMKLDSHRMLELLEGIQEGTVSIPLPAEEPEWRRKQRRKVRLETMRKFKKWLMVFAMVAGVLSSTAMTAFAYTGDTGQTETTGEAAAGETQPVIPEQTESGEETEAAAQDGAAEGAETPFSIPGNGEVLDDKAEDGTKEFLTIQTKNGNTFFLVLDRSSNTENVYMLSMIDENDLAEFMDETQTEETPQVVIPETEPTVAPEEAETETVQPEEGGMNMGAILAIGILAAGAIGAGYYFKVVKPKKEETQEDGEDLEFYDGGSYINEDQAEDEEPADKEDEEE